MMECKETTKLLSLYLDGEFSDSEKLEIDEHLYECKRCNNILEEEKEVKTIISNIKLARTPVELRNRIEKVIVGETRSILFGNALRYAGAFSFFTVAIISTVVVTRSMQKNSAGTTIDRVACVTKMEKRSMEGTHRSGLMPVAHSRYKDTTIPSPAVMVTQGAKTKRSRTKDSVKMVKSKKSKFMLTPRMMENLVVKHVRRLPVEIKSKDPRMVAKWYGKRTGFYMAPPKFASWGGKMVGSRLSNFNGGEAIQVIYNIKGRRVTLFMFDPKMMPGIVDISGVKQFQKLNSSNYLMKTPGGRMVAMFSHKGTGYSVISNQNTNTMISLVKTVILK
jgi:anti-sigma factor RsiW